MKVTGIVAEYNPFTNGHLHQINTVKNNGSDYVIAVMSGDFVQRGEPAIIDKYCRTKMALNCGVDLVIELPVCYATSDASHFSSGAISILNSLGVVDELSFGVEEGFENLTTKLGTFLNNPPTLYEETLDNNLRSGLTFPKAREKALSLFFTADELKGISNPNVILGIEYIRVLNRLKSKITPAPVTRLGGGYNDNELDKNNFSSATAIREIYADSFDPELIKDHIPPVCLDILCDSFSKEAPILSDDFSSLMHYKLLTESSYSDFTDITPAFAEHIKNKLNEYRDLSSFTDILKSKNITRTSVSRLLLHILLNMKQTTPKHVSYARVLGFRESSAELLSAIKNKGEIPLITKLADASPNPQLSQDIMAASIYESIKQDIYGTPAINEYKRQIIKI